MTACGVCGTDTLKIYGAYPKPQKLGHEVVATVHALGAGVTQFSVGQRVGLAHHVPDYGSHYAQRGSETMDAQFKRSNIEPGGFSEFIRVPASACLEYGGAGARSRVRPARGVHGAAGLLFARA